MSPTNRELPPNLGGQIIGSQDARQGLKTGHMRWVLGISVTLAVVVLSGIWFFYPRPISMSLGSSAAPVASNTASLKPTATPNPTLQ
jgi:hypothetical protein